MRRSDRLSLAIKEVANSVMTSLKKPSGTIKNTKSSNPNNTSSMKPKHNTSINNDEDFKFDTDKKHSSDSRQQEE